MNQMIWNTATVTPTYIGPAGTSFFVGLYFDNLYGTPVVAVDTDNSQGRSWLPVDSDPALIDLNSLATNPLDSLFPFNGLNFFVRALGSDGVMSNDCDADGLLDQCDTDECR